MEAISLIKLFMIDHVSAHVNDLAKAKEFYSKALKPLGYESGMELTEWNVMGFTCMGKSDFWVNGDGATQDTHIAFSATSTTMVDDFYQATIAAGGKDNGKPGYRKDYSPGYYAALAFDPDGHHLEAVFHDPSPSA